MKQPNEFAAAGEDLRIGDLDPGLGLGVDATVVQRRTPVRRALEYGQVADCFGDLGDCLHAGGAGADYGHPLAFKSHLLVRPGAGVIGFAAEVLHARDGRQGGRRQRTDRGDEEARADTPAVLECELPLVGVLVVCRRHDPAVERDVPPQVEFVGDVVAVAQRLGLGGEMLAPVPFLQQLVGEGEAVGPALGVEARSWIAVPVPGAADAVAGFEDVHRKSELAQPVELVHARKAGTDDADLVTHRRANSRLRRGPRLLLCNKRHGKSYSGVRRSIADARPSGDIIHTA